MTLVSVFVHFFQDQRSEIKIEKELDNLLVLVPETPFNISASSTLLMLSVEKFRIESGFQVNASFDAGGPIVSPLLHCLIVSPVASKKSSLMILDGSSAITAVH